LQGRDNLLKTIPDSLCTIQRLETLDLGSNEIEEIPSLVGRLANLKVLWLDLNQLKSIPSEIGKLKRLQYLELSENMLETLPEEIAGCTSLTDLHLAQNSIEYIPSSIGQLANLNILKLEQNQLVVLTASIGTCTQLTELILTENLLSEIPASVGNLRLLTNLNVDRNRLSYLPDDICECESLGLLYVRDNQLVHLPEQIGQLKKLKVLDVAGNKLAYLPYSLTEANLNAIWLAENQTTGKIKLQPDIDEETQKEVLTCYLLPQQNFHTPSMENLLQGSITTGENVSQAEKAAASAAHNESHAHKQQTSESVRFAPESDNEEKPSHFERKNTPHPKELMKKKEQLKQRNSNNPSLISNTPTTANSARVNPDSNSEMSATSAGNPNLPVLSAKSNPNETNANHTNASIKNSTASVNSAKKEEKEKEEEDENVNNVEADQDEENEVDDDDNDDEDNHSKSGHGYGKHVDFKLNEKGAHFNEEEEEQEEEDEANTTSGSGHCRLRRRDTPHHLKGARVNTSNNKAQQLDPSEMKEILERYAHTNNPSTSTSPSGDFNSQNSYASSFSINKTKPKPASVYVPDNLEYDELRKLIQLVIQINRQEGAGLGIRIAGGKGSSPYKEDDEGIFITRILPESPAKTTGLKVGDKLLKVNQTVLNDLTHQQAADTLKEAVKSGNQLTLSVIQELDLSKLFFIQIPSMNESNENLSSGFRINHNFNTHQQREVEIIFIADHKRFGQLSKGDILLQINGKNVDSISEKDLNKFVINSSNPKCPNEYVISCLTIYRPFVEEQMNTSEANNEDDDRSSQQDNEHQDRHEDSSDNNNNNNKDNNHENGIAQNGNSPNGQTDSLIRKNATNDHIVVETESLVNGHKTNGMNGASGETPKIVNRPISSSTPVRNKLAESAEESAKTENHLSSEYPSEEILINKANGAMGLSIVGGGNVACHPFGIEKPGIFISKIVPDGPASKTSLKVGDRILKVNDVDVTQMSHDDTVDELKSNSSKVVLFVSHDPQPSGMQEVLLKRSHPEETLGIRINGGIENKSANPFDASDEGIFVVNIINDTIAHRDGRLQVGTRIMEVS
jgi:protein scribble